MFDRIERLGNLGVHPSAQPLDVPLIAVVIDVRNIPAIDASSVQVIIHRSNNTKIMQMIMIMEANGC